jgi:site-specific recombinase XerD
LQAKVYAKHPVCQYTGKVFPVSSNQKMNEYLKEIAGLCGINKELTYHIARHTFATTVTLANGVSIESVSKMLSHTKFTFCIDNYFACFADNPDENVCV